LIGMTVSTWIHQSSNVFSGKAVLSCLASEGHKGERGTQGNGEGHKTQRACGAPALNSASPDALACGLRVRPQQIQWLGQSAMHARGEKSLAAAVVRVPRQNYGFDERGTIVWPPRFVVVVETPGQGRILDAPTSKWLEIAGFATRKVLSRSCRVCFICTAARECLCLARRSIHLRGAASGP
jgi:hypothetical protein